MPPFSPPPRPNGTGDSARRHVLLIESHHDTAWALSLLMQRWGYDVSCAGTAGQAMAIAKDQTVDIIVGEIVLPDMSGLELLSGLRSYTNAPAIALTSLAHDREVEDCLRAGYLIHLSKPTCIADLRKALVTLDGNE